MREEYFYPFTVVTSLYQVLLLWLRFVMISNFTTPPGPAPLCDHQIVGYLYKVGHQRLFLDREGLFRQAISGHKV